MARFSKLIFLLILVCLSSCQNEGYIGDLYGQWTLTSSRVDSKTIQHENLYLSFQGQVVMAKNTNPELHTINDVFGKFVHEGDSLFMVFYQKNNITSPQVLIEQQFRFEDSKNIRLFVHTLNDSKMCLTDGDNQWLFSKY